MLNHLNIAAYEFYFRDIKKGDTLIGILPERRRMPERVTHESIMKWAEVVFGNSLEIDKIYFVPIKLEESKTKNYFPQPY